MLAAIVTAVFLGVAAAIPSVPYYFDGQLVDHFSTPGSPQKTFTQRFASGPGMPGHAIFYSIDRIDISLLAGRIRLFHTPPPVRSYYKHDSFWTPGGPIFVIMGGEGAIEPSTGIY